MAKRRKYKGIGRAIEDPLEAVPWAIDFANFNLSEKSWRESLRDWFGVSLEALGDDSPPNGEHPSDRVKSSKWHFGGMPPSLAHIRRTQESIRDTLNTLADRGTVPRDVVARVNSYLMGLHGFKFHITTEFPAVESPGGEPEGNDRRGATPGDIAGKGVQPQTLRLEPKTFDLRSLFYYRFSLFLISASAERVKRCKQCGAFFIQRFNHRKLYCGDLCRFRSHNEARLVKKTKSGRRRPPTLHGEEGYVWWKKYEPHPSND